MLSNGNNVISNVNVNNNSSSSSQDEDEATPHGSVENIPPPPPPTTTTTAAAAAAAAEKDRLHNSLQTMADQASINFRNFKNLRTQF